MIILFICSKFLFANSIVYFSPKGGCEQKVIELTEQTKNFIDIAMYSLNNPKIIEALDKAKARDVKIRILIDRTQGLGVNKKITLALKQKGYDIKIHSVNRTQHNKFAVFDNSKIITGSFNWTNTAEQSNEENCVILDDPDVVNSFETQFEKHLWIVNTLDKSNKRLEKLEVKRE